MPVYLCAVQKLLLQVPWGYAENMEVPGKNSAWVGLGFRVQVLKP